ncbi:MAG: RnfABCDGE type electron transport complex subunit A [Treponemataceae bacterium]|uniref:electron transport complex protein RnfA n=1 Tax=Treponema sp. J25 TaxID=2094121 RepID=UPI001045C813|nr:RnfABCDGE type electron transport complex subunit A [Treponema sp. J25]MCX7949556.1 RnfABCDGE type electron transport complex subunit A [Treponemataceae bacterium]HOJ99295.1 RnfABCDGE type electron transport complex subunit A [Termitinemataceae bacterium]TCW61556.1 electron transport complex subunit RsxA [Treponema sp. J25]HOM24319.1 RnfABCDGE type electron transport complex subunit A [Termitinemataceae bacterium]HPQ00659.1 RnfABCDGE type electron transport complex subunit A [Termitinematac
MNLFKIFISALLIDNVILMRFLALCPFIGMSSDENKSVGMGLAVTFVTVLATSVTWPIYHFILKPLGLEFLQILVFILIIASLVQLVEFYLKKMVPALYTSMGIYLALITTNCAILAVTFDNISKGYSFLEALVYAVGAALGFLLSLLLMAGIRNRIKTSPIPAFLKGTPILFVSASLLAMAFMGFSGLVK